MSTKTTFKRVALVAVAAMGFGMLSVVPSSADATHHTFEADVLSISAATSTLTVGSTASITATMAMIAGSGTPALAAVDSMTVTASFTSAPAGATTAELGNFIFTSGSNAMANTTVAKQFAVQPITASLYTEVKYTVKLTPLKAGTYVIKLTPAVLAADLTALNATAQTWTVTVGAQAEAGAPDATSTSVMSKGITAVATGSASDAVRVPMAVGSAVAVIRVSPNVLSTPTTGSTSVTATITGPGTLGINGLNTSAAASVGRSITYTHTTTGDAYIYVWADGTSGTSTITYTTGTFTGTKTVYFYGAAASVTTTNKETVIDSGSGAASTGILLVTVKDANGNAVPGATVYAVSGTTTVFASSSVTTGSTGTATVSALGLTAGTSAVTVQNVATGSTATFSAAAVSIRAGDDLASSVTMTLDKATYAQGEAAVLTVTVKDAAGNLVSAGTQSIFTAAGATSTRATGGVSLPGASFVSAGSTYGVTTYNINAPTTQGAFTISGTLGGDLLSAGSTVAVTATVSPSAAETAAVAAAAANAAATAAAIAAAADIASAAVDAAAEATDAANAATDAANAAAEAADAATAAAQDAADAVASLATAVTELMADLKAQIAAQKAAITALTNLVIKIQKKIKA